MDSLGDGSGAEPARLSAPLRSQAEHDSRSRPSLKPVRNSTRHHSPGARGTAYPQLHLFGGSARARGSEFEFIQTQWANSEDFPQPGDGSDAIISQESTLEAAGLRGVAVRTGTDLRAPAAP